MPTDDPDFGVSVVASASVSYSAGALYAPDIAQRLDPQGSLGLVRAIAFFYAPVLCACAPVACSLYV